MGQKSAAHVTKMARAETVRYGCPIEVKIGTVCRHGFVIDYCQGNIRYVPSDTGQENANLNDGES